MTETHISARLNGNTPETCLLVDCHCQGDLVITRDSVLARDPLGYTPGTAYVLLAGCTPRRVVLHGATWCPSSLSLSRLVVYELVPRQAQQRCALTDVHVHKVLPVAVYRPPHVGLALVLAAAAARAGSRGGGVLGGDTLHRGFIRRLVAAGEKGKAWSHTCFVQTSLFEKSYNLNSI